MRSPRRLSPKVVLRTVAATLAIAAPAPARAAGFERIVIDNDFPGGYQVEVADVNGDGRPDVVGVGGGTCAWYENPTWKKRVVTTPKQTPGIISSATADLDGDGKAEIAIAYEFSMNEPTKGKLLLAVQGKSADAPWTVTPVIDVMNFEYGGGLGGGGTIEEGRKLRGSGVLMGGIGGGGNFVGGGNIGGGPLLGGSPPRRDEIKPVVIGSIHRLRWGCVIGKPRLTAHAVVFDKQPELVVAPIFGPKARPPAFDQAPAQLVVFIPGGAPKSGRWSQSRIGEAPVLHAIDVVDVDGNGISVVLGASNLGVTQFQNAGVTNHFLSTVLAPGAPGKAPKKGASEVHLGRLKDGRRFLATVEPWHGTEVCVYLSESRKLKFGPRSVIDSTLKDGHALWVSDVDGDGDDEVFAGYRGEGTSVLAFDYNRTTQAWDRTVVDDAIAAQDLCGGDLDGDGAPDVVAIGGKTHNVVWYKPRPASRPRR